MPYIICAVHKLCRTQLVTALQDCYLAYYLTELAGATFMIFTRTCDNTRKMALMLRNLGFDAIPIHGQMAQAKRIGALNKFKAGERSILCATGKGLLHFFSAGISVKRRLHAERQTQTPCRAVRVFYAKACGLIVCGNCVL